MVLSQCMGFSYFGLQLGSVKMCFGSGHSVLGSFGVGDVVWLSQAGGSSGFHVPSMVYFVRGGAPGSCSGLETKHPCPGFWLWENRPWLWLRFKEPPLSTFCCQ